MMRTSETGHSGPPMSADWNTKYGSRRVRHDPPTLDEAIFAAVIAGAAGYVLKQIRGSNLIDAVRQVAAGRSLLDPSVTARVLSHLREEKQADDRLAALNAQERRILDLIAEGLTNRQIGERLFLAEKTIKNNISGLLSKLGMQRRTQAAVYGANLRDPA